MVDYFYQLEENYKAFLSSYQEGNLLRAKELINTVDLEGPYGELISHDFKHKYYMYVGHVYGDLGLYEDALSFYKLSNFYGNLLKTQFTDEYIRLYQFRRFSDYSLYNLKNNQFSLTNPKLMNDPLDSLIYTWADSETFNRSTQEHLKPLKASFDYYRVASFCMNTHRNKAVENNLMWSHYADEHKGFCVEYRIHKNDYRRENIINKSAYYFKKVDYQKIFKLEGRTTLNTNEALAMKARCWKYENEVRLISYNPSIDSGERDVFTLGEGSLIKAIYFGIHCPDYVKELIIGMLHDRKVKFFKMANNPSNAFKLKYAPIA